MKDTCKQVVFRKSCTRAKIVLRSLETGDHRIKKTGVLQNIYKHPVEYKRVLWTCNLSERVITESRKPKECFRRQVSKQLIRGKDQVQSLSKRVKKVNHFKMSEEKDDLKSIKVYKFSNTKESWHEFALKFGVIADSRGYEEIIDGTKSTPDETEVLEILEKMMRIQENQRKKSW